MTISNIDELLNSLPRPTLLAQALAEKQPDPVSPPTAEEFELAIAYFHSDFSTARLRRVINAGNSYQAMRWAIVTLRHAIIHNQCSIEVRK